MLYTQINPSNDPLTSNKWQDRQREQNNHPRNRFNYSFHYSSSTFLTLQIIYMLQHIKTIQTPKYSAHSVEKKVLLHFSFRPFVNSETIQDFPQNFYPMEKLFQRPWNSCFELQSPLTCWHLLIYSVSTQLTVLQLLHDLLNSFFQLTINSIHSMSSQDHS